MEDDTTREPAAGVDEHPPPDLMAIYLACDAAPGDTPTEIERFREAYGNAGDPA